MLSMTLIRTAVCRVCSIKISDTTTTTSNFIRHYKKTHRERFGGNIQYLPSIAAEQPQEDPRSNALLLFFFFFFLHKPKVTAPQSPRKPGLDQQKTRTGSTENPDWINRTENPDWINRKPGLEGLTTMSKISEEEWKRDLTIILEDLNPLQYEKMKECLRDFPQVRKDGRSKEKMPGKIIEFYGKEKSILEIERVMEQIPKRNDLVQRLLKPYVQKVRSKPEKQQHEMKRRREKEPEEGTSPAADQLDRSQSVKIRVGEEEKLKTRDSQDGKAPWEKSIFDLKSSGILETEAIVGKVVKKSELLKYDTKTKKGKFYFVLGVADETACVKLMVYGKDLHRQIKEGSSYIFRELIQDEKYVKVNALSSVSETKPVIVPEEFEREAERLLSPESPLTSIKDIKSSRPQTHVSVKGTVTQIL